MASIINELFHIELSRTVVTIIIILITCVIYTYSLLHGFKGISFLAKKPAYTCSSDCFCLYYFLEEKQNSLLKMVLHLLEKWFKNFFELSTFTDPERTTSFPQNYTIYYWAYWMVWCVAAPFFIGNISGGRTVRQTILGGYVFGVGSTIVSFIVLGNYSLGKQISGQMDFIAAYEKTGGSVYNDHWSNTFSALCTVCTCSLC